MTAGKPGSWVARFYDGEKFVYPQGGIGDFSVLPDNEQFDAAKKYSDWKFTYSAEVVAENQPVPVAAVPSLHAAYALLTVLIALSWRRRVGLALLPYPILMWFSIVYLGDHYVVDILAGVAVALVGWLLAGRLVRQEAPLHRLVLAGAAAPLRLARPFGGPT